MNVQMDAKYVLETACITQNRIRIWRRYKWKVSVLYVFVLIARSRMNAKFVTSVIPALENMRKVNVLMVGLNQIIRI